MRKAVRAPLLALVLALSCPTFAGIIHNPGPEQQPPQSDGEAPAGGEIPNPLVDEYAATAEAALYLLRSALALP